MIRREVSIDVHEKDNEMMFDDETEGGDDIETVENDLKENDLLSHNNIDDYRKLNVQSLKSIAISKGLSSDPSKLKKKELLHLLA